MFCHPQTPANVSYRHSVGFWVAVFASLLGVWQSVPYLYAEIFGVMKGLSALLVIVTDTVIGGLFVPFPAATLLYLNNRVAWAEDEPKNALTTNLLLVAILVLFVAAGAQEAMNALRRIIG